MSETDKQIIQGQQQEGEGDTYTVESIAEKRLDVYTGKLEYRIRWLGYTEKDDTWEPAENMSHLAAAKEFEDSLKKKEKVESQKKRASKGGRPKSSNGATVAKRKTGSITSGVTTRKTNPPPASADVSHTATQEKAREKPKKVPTATMIQEKDFGGDSVGDAEVLVGNPTDLRLEEPTPGKHYKIQDGAAAKEILSVACRGGGDPVSVVEYEDSTFEIVPTKVLADHCPKMLISFYEARLVYKA